MPSFAASAVKSTASSPLLHKAARMKRSIRLKVNRWTILIASMLLNMCIGSAYAWSVFQKPLIAMFKWTVSETSLAFSLSLFLVPVAMVVAGKIQDRIGPRRVIIAGGIVFCTGIVAAGFTSSLAHLYLSYGVLGGIGNGMIYACTVANTVKWFPDRRGMASGLVVAGFGSGAVLLAPLAAALIQSHGVLPTFVYLGTGYAVVMAACALFVRNAPADFGSSGVKTPVAAEKTTAGMSSIDKDWRSMLVDPVFYILFGMYVIGCISGLMIIAHASPIGQEIIRLSPADAAAALGLLAVANTTGRLFWGWLSDWIGRCQSCIALFLILGTTMFLIGSASSFSAFAAALMTVGFCFGGFLGVFPSMTADMFGLKNLGMNYGIMFLGFGLAALIGPPLAATIKELYGGDYSRAFLIAGSLCAAGVFLTLLAMYLGRRKATAPGQGNR